MAIPPGYARRLKSIICLRRGITNESPTIAPVTQHRTISTGLKSVTPSYWSLRMNSAGTENIIPDEAAFTAEARLWLMLFSTMLVRRMMPRRIPQPRIAASSEPSMENPRIRAA